MSGGPLLNREGCLIGIASGNSGGEAYYVDEFEIANLINGNSATKSFENLE
jgi:S1-C subfamily serine protease